MFFGWFDPMYLLFVGPCLILSGICTWWVKSSFAKYSQVGARNGMTGAQIAKAILEYNNVHDVSIEVTGGYLSDHYDPTSRTLRLSEQNYSGKSIAALGIAAHEVGHAIQHAEAYIWLGMRSKLVPIASLGTSFSYILVIAGTLLHFSGLAQLGVFLFGFATLFTLITLPVEFDASNRAIASLEGGAILQADELVGARRVLRAAASTYVAAAITSIATLLYFAMRAGLLGGNDD
ncbi:MAG: Zn-dependent membrane protease YugP [Planctomycetota bacterium]|jgi:Zn-dependent membrane protease YugP